MSLSAMATPQQSLVPASDAFSVDEFAGERPGTAPGLRTLDELLRDGAAIRARIAAGRGLAELARTAILTVLVGGGVFGATLGAFHGGAQILLSALKLPLAILLTAAVCAPTLTALNSALDRPASLRRDLALVLSSAAIGSLVLAAESPIILLGMVFKLGYHKMLLITVACCAIAGAVGVGVLWDGLASSAGRMIVGTGLLLVLGTVGSQMAWTLRPFLVHPRGAQRVVVLRGFDRTMRGLDGNFFDSAWRSTNSARGIYEISTYNSAAPASSDKAKEKPPGPEETGGGRGLFRYGGEIE